MEWNHKIRVKAALHWTFDIKQFVGCIEFIGNSKYQSIRTEILAKPQFSFENAVLTFYVECRGGVGREIDDN